MLSFAALAILGGAAAASALLSLLDASRSPAPARVDALEQRVDALQNELQAQSLVQAAMRPRSAAEAAPPFRVDCPPPWRELGAIGQGLWGCQTPEPLADGFHPNCNLTSASIDADMTPRAYYEQASSRGALRRARQLGGREVSLREPAYQASFEHELTGKTLHVLATVFVRTERALVLTCSAPPDVFEQHAPQFQTIARSFSLP